MKLWILLILVVAMGCSTIGQVARALRGPTAEEACGSKTGDALTICLTQWQADQNRRAADNVAFWANHNAQMNTLQAARPVNCQSMIMPGGLVSTNCN